jgi:hypothetical protein
VTPEWLWRQFVGRTDIQAQGLVKSYLGKWMRISGKLGNFSSLGVGTHHSLTFESSRFEGFHNVMMYFRAPLAVDKLAVMPPGEAIDVLGQVDSIDSIYIRLKDCELV